MDFVKDPYYMTLGQAFLRALLLRCPVCGQGKLFRAPFKMNEHCSNCGLIFEREVGYFSSSMASNLVVSELLIAAFVVPLAANPAFPLTQLFIWGSPAPILLPIIFYPTFRSLRREKIQLTRD